MGTVKGVRTKGRSKKRKRIRRLGRGFLPGRQNNECVLEAGITWVRRLQGCMLSAEPARVNRKIEFESNRIQFEFSSCLDTDRAFKNKPSY